MDENGLNGLQTPREQLACISSSLGLQALINAFHVMTLPRIWQQEMQPRSLGSCGDHWRSLVGCWSTPSWSTESADGSLPVLSNMRVRLAAQSAVFSHAWKLDGMAECRENCPRLQKCVPSGARRNFRFMIMIHGKGCYFVPTGLGYGVPLQLNWVVASLPLECNISHQYYLSGSFQQVEYKEVMVSECQNSNIIKHLHRSI